ncbi:MAG: bifunctional nuclease family protein, partial [Acidimicrobiales bacterium]|nr:bifunctional nuclease family protein [Acidimicrobiales bacterium]
MIEMELVGVRVEMPSSSPLALLREVDGERRVLPIFIGSPEATAIAFALEEVVTPRPMTHDLLRDLLDELGASLER